MRRRRSSSPNPSDRSLRPHRHYHRSGEEFEDSGTRYYGILEKEGVFVGTDGTFLTEGHPEGFRGWLAESGYLQVCVGRKVLAHRVVYEVCGNRTIPEDCEIDHINGNRQDNRLDNLRAVSHTANVRNPVSRVRYQKSWDARPGDSWFSRRVSTGLKAYLATEDGKRARIARTRRLNAVWSDPDFVRRQREKASPVPVREIEAIELRTGRTLRFPNIRRAALELGLHKGHISEIVNGGRQNSTKGWTFRAISDFHTPG